MVNYMCKKNCLSCHFFCIYGDHQYQGRWQVVVLQKERDQIIKDKSFYYIQEYKVDYRTYLCCFKGVWDENKFIEDINPRKGLSEFGDIDKEKLENTLWETVVKVSRKERNSRGNSCFYREFEEGMLLPAAEELEKREAIQKEASRDRKWVIVGIVVTALATLGAVMLANYLSHKNDYSLHIINQPKNGKSTNIAMPIKGLSSVTVLLEFKK